MLRLRILLCRRIDVIRDEPINIGVIVRDLGRAAADARFLPADSLTRKVGDMGLSLALALEDSLKASAFDPAGTAEALASPDWFDVARREFHGHLRLSEPAGLLATSLGHATARVFATYVAESPKPSNSPRSSVASLSPSRMKKKLWSAFDRVKLFDSGRARKQYEARGRHATWEFDVGYRNGALSVINALAISTNNPRANLDSALLYKGMVIEVKEQATENVRAMAVVPTAPANGAVTSYAEAQQILVDADIQTFAMDDVANLARKVQAELENHLFSAD